MSASVKRIRPLSKLLTEVLAILSVGDEEIILTLPLKFPATPYIVGHLFAEVPKVVDEDGLEE
tara:strand:+ start:241 stop:429 length:189 start_codon:yes stop_codon:yes gene_type:complete